jgi:hypothetical protein
MFGGLLSHSNHKVSDVGVRTGGGSVGHGLLTISGRRQRECMHGGSRRRNL